MDNQTPPAGDLTWLSDAELGACAATFEDAGFGPPLNWFRNLLRNWQDTEQFAGATVRQPAGFMVGEKDVALSMLRDAVEGMPNTVPDLRVNLTLPGIGHWTQQQAPEAVNAALLDFLDGVSMGQRAGPVLCAPASRATSLAG